MIVLLFGGISHSLFSSFQIRYNTLKYTRQSSSVNPILIKTKFFEGLKQQQRKAEIKIKNLFQMKLNAIVVVIVMRDFEKTAFIFFTNPLCLF